MHLPRARSLLAATAGGRVSGTQLLPAQPCTVQGCWLDPNLVQTSHLQLETA